MNWWRSLVGLGGRTWQFVQGLGGDAGNAATGLWRMVRQAGQGLSDILTHPITNAINAVANAMTAATGDSLAFLRALLRITPYLNNNYVAPLRMQVLSWLAALRARISYLIGLVYAYINAEIAKARRYSWALVHHERIVRRREIRHTEAYTRRHVRWALALIQREAASGYNMTRHDRLGIIGKLADIIVNRNPVVKDLVGRIMAGMLDLAEVDDPVLRIALGFLVKELVKRLGVDKVTGALLDDLIGPLIGQAKPRNLHDVIEDIGLRLNAIEGQWATFMQDGGPEILQAGEQWEGLTGLLADAGMLAFFGAMVADPTTWAADVADTLGPVVGGAVDAVNAALNDRR